MLSAASRQVCLGVALGRLINLRLNSRDRVSVESKAALEPTEIEPVRDMMRDVSMVNPNLNNKRRKTGSTAEGSKKKTEVPENPEDVEKKRKLKERLATYKTALKVMKALHEKMDKELDEVKEIEKRTKDSSTMESDGS